MRAPGPRDAAITGGGAMTPGGVGLPVLLDPNPAHAPPGFPGGRRDPGPRRPEAVRVPQPWLREPIPDEHLAQAKFLNGSGQMAVTAVREAIAAAGLPAGPTPDERRGLYLAQLDWGAIEFADFRAPFLEATDGFTKPWTPAGLHDASVRKLNPFYLLDTLNNNAYSCLTALLGWMGPGTSLSGSSGPGLLAVAMAARAVRRGDADAMLAVGAAKWTDPVARLEHAVRGTDPRRPGEGAGAVLLEPLAAARARGAVPEAIVFGWGAASGRVGEAEPVVAAIRAALADAGAHPSEFDVVIDPCGAVTAEIVARVELGIVDEDAREAVFTSIDGGDWGDLGPAGDVVAVATASRPYRDQPDDPPILLVARGLDGEVTALVLGGCA